MTTYLLDTDIIEYMGDTASPHHRNCVAHLERLTETDQLCVSVLSLYELEYSIAGASAGLKPRLQASKQKLLDFYTILPLSEPGSQHYGRLKNLFKDTSGTKHRAMKTHTVDMILASTALEHDAILVSNDRLFSTLARLDPKLKVENWAEVA